MSDALEVIVLDSDEDAAPEVESSDAGGAVSNIISRMSLDTKQELLTTLRSGGEAAFNEETRELLQLLG